MILRFYVPKPQYDYLACSNRGLWIDFDHLGLLNVHPNRSIQVFCNLTPTIAAAMAGLNPQQDQQHNAIAKAATAG